MKAIRWFEASVRSLVEGRLGRFFGARVQPVDIARALAERMEDDVAIGAGRRYAPNAYRVFLAAETLARFEAYRLALEEELAAGLNARGAARGLDFVGRVRVSLIQDAGVRSERMRIEADRVDRHGVVVGGLGAMTEAIRVGPGLPEAPQAMAVRSGNRRVFLPVEPMASVTLGRGLDNDVVIDGATVSRRHARLSARGSHWHIEDLDSTHGTWVNGRRVASAVLREGDRIGLGSAVLTIESGAGEREARHGAPEDAPDRDPLKIGRQGPGGGP